jgi:hypothetical protein
MMKKENHLLAEEHLKYLDGIKLPETDPFFYTRLKARMEKEHSASHSNFTLKPVWLVAAMVLVLIVNVFMIGLKNKTVVGQSDETASVKGFAASYDQSVPSY